MAFTKKTPCPVSREIFRNQARPMQALKILGEIPEGSLPEKLEAIRRQLARRAEALREEGHLELDEDLG